MEDQAPTNVKDFKRSELSIVQFKIPTHLRLGVNDQIAFLHKMV
ncbi:MULTISPECIES: hypothetical protein [Lysinibacillus]|nr:MULTISPECIES: hypothetical protein [Lysinibacillus]